MGDKRHGLFPMLLFILIAKVPRGNILLQDWHLYCERRDITRQYDKATRREHLADIVIYLPAGMAPRLSYSQVNSNPKEEEI